MIQTVDDIRGLPFYKDYATGMLYRQAGPDDEPDMLLIPCDVVEDAPSPSPAHRS